MNTRLHYLDSLRAGIVLGVLILHSAMAYTTPDLYPWPFHDPNTSMGFNIFIYILHTFLMPSFFLLAGFWGCYIHKSRGTQKFFRDRCKRIALPFIIMMALFIPYHVLQLFGDIYLQLCKQYPTISPQIYILHMKPMLIESLHNGAAFRFLSNPEYLWFLYYLIIYYAVVGVLLKGRDIAVKLVPQQQQLQQRSDKQPVNRIISHLLRYPLLWVIPSTLVLLACDQWYTPPPRTLMPEFTGVVYYGLFFTFGWLFYHKQSQIQAWAQQQWHYLLLLFMSLPIYLYLQAFAPEFTAQHPQLSASVALFAEATSIWSIILLLLGFCYNHANQANPIIRYIADAAYWIYLIRVPIIIGLQLWVAHMDISLLDKFLLVMSFTLFIVLVSYQLFVRNSALGRWLNGRKPSTHTNEDDKEITLHETGVSVRLR